MRITKAEDREKRIAQCVALIAQVRRARGWEDFARLSDGELIEGLADRLTTDPDEHRLILCAFALRVGREIEPVCALLAELGISDVDPQNLTAARHSAVNEHFERALRELNPDGELSQMVRIRELAISVGSIALNGNGADTEAD
jgi:hypothetical protein